MYQVERKVKEGISVKWQAPNAGRSDAAITSYTIYYTCASSGETRINNPSARSYILNDIGYVNCSVDVVATNSLGNSSPRDKRQKSVVTQLQWSNNRSGTHLAVYYYM